MLVQVQTIIILGERDNAFDDGISLENRDGFLGSGDDGERLGGGGGRKGERVARELEVEGGAMEGGVEGRRRGGI